MTTDMEVISRPLEPTQGVDLNAVPLTLIGHPWAPIGMGEQLRSHVRALQAVWLAPKVYDIFRYAQRNDESYAALLDDIEAEDVPGGFRIFHINGDEVERVIEAFETRGNDFSAGHNIVVPAWELASYPDAWARQLRKFDEVWSLSRFIAESLQAGGLASTLIGQSVEPAPGPYLPRRNFGIRESAFVLLNFFDLSSYAARKNPDAALELFERLRAEDPFRDIQLVLKVKNGERGAQEWAATLRPDSQVKVISHPLDALAAQSLINACDCFVSLHRAEGFGRGLGEAMAMGRLAMGTGWSGNVDFMNPRNALLVDHRLVPLERDQYPHWQGQSWAEPDVEHAVELLRPILDDPARGRDIALRGQASVLRSHGHRAVGLRAAERLRAITTENAKLEQFAPAKVAKRGRKTS